MKEIQKIYMLQCQNIQIYFGKPSPLENLGHINVQINLWKTMKNWQKHKLWSIWLKSVFFFKKNLLKYLEWNMYTIFQIDEVSYIYLNYHNCLMWIIARESVYCFILIHTQFTVASVENLMEEVVTSNQM